MQNNDFWLDDKPNPLKQKHIPISIYKESITEDILKEIEEKYNHYGVSQWDWKEKSFLIRFDKTFGNIKEPFQIPCSHCGLGITVNIKEYLFYHDYRSSIVCKECKGRMEQQGIDSNLVSANIPSKFYNANFDNWKTDWDPGSEVQKDLLKTAKHFINSLDKIY